MQSKRGYLRRHAYSIIALTCMMLWLLDVFYLHKIRHQIQAAEIQKQAASTPKLALATLSAKSFTPINRIELPPVPERNTSQVAEKIMVAKGRIALIDEAFNRDTFKPSNEALRAVTMRMLAMDSKDIRFLLPESERNKETFLKHMYRCENMQFAALSTSKTAISTSKAASSISKANQLSLLSHPNGSRQQASQLLRVAHDYLSKYERNLMQVYAQRSIPVRIFTAELDNRLAKRMAIKLRGQELKQFSGRYFIENSKMGLKELIINNQHLPEQWVLSSNRCLSL